MVHGKSVDECGETLAAIAVATGIRNHQALYSGKEYKRFVLRYFTGEEEAWEAGLA